MIKENPNTIVVDSGNLTNGGDPYKLDIIASAMAKIGYCAVGVGELDARLADLFHSKMAEHKLTVVDTSPAADTRAVPFVLKNVGEVRVGILSFGVAPPNVTVDDMELRKMRFTALRDAREKSDVLVLLDQAGIATKEWLERNGSRMGAPDIVIRGYGSGGHDYEDVAGRTRIMPATFQTKQMGVIDLEVAPAQEAKVKLTRLTLDETFDEDAVIRTSIDEAMKAAGLQPPAHGTASPGNSSIAVVQKPVYLPAYCKHCHLKQYEDWEHTKHARALQTLVNEQKTTPECLPCHSERFRATGRFVPPTNGIGGVDCATCHADSLPHGMERKDMAQRAKVRPGICLECHTKERSPDYDEKTFFPRVAHSTSGVGPATASVPTGK